MYKPEGYPINCTGNCVAGDEVTFERAVFGGTWKKPEFSHMERVTGKIVKESYGEEKQQHTFTILTPGGRKIRIKGRNLYKEGVWRKPWTDESSRLVACEEKWARGDAAREEREIRREERIF